MINLSFLITPTMSRLRARPGFVCRSAPIAGLDGRSVPIDVEYGGRAP
ncbi:MAG: hypothetical protein ACREMJ_06960 [Gemmatimonadales bacterium]